MAKVSMPQTKAKNQCVSQLCTRRPLNNQDICIKCSLVRKAKGGNERARQRLIDEFDIHVYTQDQIEQWESTNGNGDRNGTESTGSSRRLVSSESAITDKEESTERSTMLQAVSARG